MCGGAPWLLTRARALSSGLLHRGRTGRSLDAASAAVPTVVGVTPAGINGGADGVSRRPAKAPAKAGGGALADRMGADALGWTGNAGWEVLRRCCPLLRAPVLQQTDCDDA